MLLLLLPDLSENPEISAVIFVMAVAIVVVLVLLAIWLLKKRRLAYQRKRKYLLQAGLSPKEREYQMAELARSHGSVKLKRKNYIVANYNQTAYKKINIIRSHIAEASPEIMTLIPSARWLFDNFQMLYREIKKVKTTGTGYLSLPELEHTEYHGYPRIYVVAKKMVEITDGYLNEESIIQLIKAYQAENPLTEREINALQEMIGLCLIERVIEVSDEIIHIISVKTKAEELLKERLVDKQGYLDINPLLFELDDTEQEIPYHAHVIFLLKNMSVDEAVIQRYISHYFSNDTKYLNASAIFREEGKIESSLESSIRTPITSLRELNQINDDEFVNELSVVEKILSKDPDGIYPGMDNYSRGMYRAVVEKLSRRCSVYETDVAQACLQLAEEQGEDIYCSSHVGAYLLGKGYSHLKAKILNRPQAKHTKSNGKARGALYISLIAVFLASTILLLILAMKAVDCNEPYKIIMLVVISLPLLIDIALKLARNITTRLVPVNEIPMMDYSEEIPEGARTVVIMPIIISKKEQGIAYAERLHKHYLANMQPNFHFALLVDFADADSKDMAEDKIIGAALISKIEELNKKHPSAYQKFSLVIRERRWSKSENCYICWERKRGKIEEFNALLNGIKPEDTSFTILVCDLDLLRTCKYVITLDADSDLIRDNAAKLVGMIDHPLNRALVDYEKKIVTEGYAIIQPMVRNRIYDKTAGPFARIFGGSSGLANYSMILSDINQDVFNQGTFVGKGIYNAEVFHKLLYKRLPEERVLSHDLLESCYARTAFASTAIIVESFPSSYISYKEREHRWIRGDWQLMPWLFKKDMGLLSKWRIADNMRASLMPVSKLLLIILSLIMTPATYWIWLPVVLFNPLLDLLIVLLGVAVHKISRPKLALVYSLMMREIGVMILKTIMDIILIPASAFNALNAITTTIYRMLFTKKHMLMWNAADDVEKMAKNTLRGYFARIGHWGLISAALIIASLIVFKRSYLVFLLHCLLCAAWGTSFLAAYIVSSGRNNGPNIEKKGRDFLYDTARRMWRFFRRFTTKENNWLCPDNYQLVDKGNNKVTVKTSPTNIGLQFLSILSARDFGFETLSTVMDYAENLLYTVSVLPKWEGHLYNWYNINTLEVLEPKYISTVDSGNFFGDMIALKNGLLEQRDSPIISKALIGEIVRLAALCGTEFRLDHYSKKIHELLQELYVIERLVTENEKNRDSIDMKELVKLIERTEAEVEKFGLLDYNVDDWISLSKLAGFENENASEMLVTISGLCKAIDNMLKAVNFTSLFNKKRMLFHIGYNASSKALDQGCYDLIASESMLTSFLAIAKGAVPLKHWKKLGRPLTVVRGIPAHVSWSGTMFEYIMPNLLMKEYDGSVFADSSKAAVLQQIKYAKGMEIPWGISESQYYRFDINSNYQYQAFGVPKMRLQPSYKNALVVAPYAVMLALEYAKKEAIENLEAIRKLGAYGEFGFYEAIDFNAPDPVNMTKYCIVRSFMAHHQGMSLVAINNFLNNGIMRSRFHAEPMVKATETLLEEKRQTWFVSISRKGYTVNVRKKGLQYDDITQARYIKSVAPQIPAVCYLSNGNYSILITSDGDGFSRCGDMMVHKWRPDIYAQTGYYIYVRDIQEDRYWTTSYKPSKAMADEYQAVFSHDRAEFIRLDGDIGTHTVVSLSPDHDLEIRKVTINNYSNQERQLELTSYLEVAGNSLMAESSHPAFSKLFMESEYIEENDVFISKRRGGSENPYIMHMVRTNVALLKGVEYENDRMRFIGRNNSLKDPDAIRQSMPLSNKSGFSCDPIMSLRTCVSLKPGDKVNVVFVTGVCKSREDVIRISDEVSVPYRVDDIVEKFRLQSIMELKYLNISNQQLNAYQNVISPLFYPSRYYRGPAENIKRNWKDQSSLWRFGISGDRPIMLLTINSVNEVEIIKEVLTLYEYLRINCVAVDLVLLSNAKYGYMQELDDMLNQMTSSLKIHSDKDKPGIFVIHSYQLVPSEVDLLITVASVVFTERTGIYFRSIIKDLKIESAQ